MRTYRHMTCCKCNTMSSVSYYYSMPKDWILLEVKIQGRGTVTGINGYPLCPECQEKNNIKVMIPESETFENQLRDFILEVMEGVYSND